MGDVAAGAAHFERATLQLPQRGQVHVVGTCHLSANSARAARRAVLAPERPPLAVLLELCADRTEILSYSGRAAPLPPLTLATARENWRMLVDPLFWFKLPFAGAEALVGSREGSEFTAAFQAANAVGAQVCVHATCVCVRACVCVCARASKRWFRSPTHFFAHTQLIHILRNAAVGSRSC
eukprot:COSAG03_NODE_1068_length_4911_cov_22.019534_3_plen_181_part_00